MSEIHKITNTDPGLRRVNGVDFESDEHKKVDWTDGQILNARRQKTTGEDGQTRQTFVIELVEVVKAKPKSKKSKKDEATE